MIRFRFNRNADAEVTHYQFAAIAHIVAREWGADFEITDHWFTDEDRRPSWCVVLHQRRRRMPAIEHHIDINGNIKGAHRT